MEDFDAMTARHLIDGLMSHTRARSHRDLSILLALQPSVISRIHKGKIRSMHIETLDRIQQRSNVPLDALMGWYRQPEGERLAHFEGVSMPRPAAPKQGSWRMLSLSPKPAMKSNYVAFDAALLANIDAGRNTLRAFGSEESGLRSLVAPQKWDAALAYRLQELRKKGVIRFYGGAWVRTKA